MARKQSVAIVIAIVVAAATLESFAAAKEYVVGDDKGWGLGLNYTAWAEGKEFMVGDTLLFNYPAGSHNVFKVDGQGFKACSAPPNVAPLVSGKDVVTLASPGSKWYICGKPGHCGSGQKLVVTVLPGLQAPAASPSVPPTSGSSNKLASLVSRSSMALMVIGLVMAI